MDGYEDFGKYLVSHLGFEVSDDLDWNYIVRKYTRRRTMRRKPGLMWINWTVCTHFDMDPVEVRAKRSRKRLHVIPRHTAQYLAATLFGYTQIEIGEFYGIKNRSLIPSNNGNVENLLQTDKYYKQDVEIITNKLLGHYEQDQRSDTIGGGKSFFDTAVKEGNSMSIDRNREVESSD